MQGMHVRTIFDTVLLWMPVQTKKGAIFPNHFLFRECASDLFVIAERMGNPTGCEVRKGTVPC